MFQNVLECSIMIFVFLSFLIEGGGCRGVTPICPHQVSNLFYDSRRFQKVPEGSRRFQKVLEDIHMRFGLTVSEPVR